MLFTVNFSMDILALFVTGKLLDLPVSGKRLSAAAAFGALTAVLRVIFPGEGVVCGIVWGSAAVSVGAAMCFVAFRERIRRSLPVFLAVNLTLGGLVGLLGRVMRQSFVGLRVGESSLFVFPAAAAGIVCTVFARAGARGKSIRAAEVCVGIDGNSRTFHMLVDSGALLSEPVSGRAVILVREEKLRGLLPPPLRGLTVYCLQSLDPIYARRVRLIPAESVTGRRLLIGILPDSVSVDGQVRDAVVALSEVAPDGYDGILPASLI